MLWSVSLLCLMVGVVVPFVVSLTCRSSAYSVCACACRIVVVFVLLCVVVFFVFCLLAIHVFCACSCCFVLSLLASCFL